MKVGLNIRLKKKSTPYGIKVPENKLTAKSPIETVPLPDTVILPLQQNLGAPSQARMKRGDKVLTGQKIADSDRFVSAPVHATLSGEVTATTTLINPPTGQLMEAIVITSDKADKWVELKPPANPEAIPVEEILKRVYAAGDVP